jgi:hypothetical protein
MGDNVKSSNNPTFLKNASFVSKVPEKFFPAIFANFRRKNWRFSQKPML